MNKIILSFLVGAMAAVVQAATYHVTPDAPAGSNGSGSSWANALQLISSTKKLKAMQRAILFCSNLASISPLQGLLSDIK